MSAQRITHISKQVWRNAIGVCGLRGSDVWLPSFPRSGNSWFRILLGNIIYLSEDPEKEVDLHTLYDLCPVMGFSNLLKPWEHEVMPRLLKTHQPYRAPFFNRPKRTLLQIRDPRDAMLSWYNLCSNSKVIQYEKTFEDFVRDPRYGFESWMRHYSSWRPHATAIMPYEELKADPVSTMQRCFGELGFTVPEDILRTAVNRSTIEKVRKKEEETGVRDAARFKDPFRTVGSGSSGHWKERYQEAELAYYAEVHTRFAIDCYPPGP
ncbi:MAG: hypothetical protein ACI9TH_001512 [Kiritimatiellia bacterium]|jgi:hypothetical protein